MAVSDSDLEERQMGFFNLEPNQKPSSPRYPTEERDFRPAQKKLAIVLSNFNQSIMTCDPISQAEVVIIVRSLDTIADEVLTLVADEYMSDHYKVLNGH